MKEDGNLELVVDDDTQFPEFEGDGGLKYNDEETVVEFFHDVKIYYMKDGKPQEPCRNLGRGCSRSQDRCS